MKKEIQKTNVIDSWSLQTAHQLSITFSGFSCFVAFFNSVFPLKVVRFEPYHPGRPHPPWALPREKFRDRGGGGPPGDEGGPSGRVGTLPEVGFPSIFGAESFFGPQN